MDPVVVGLFLSVALGGSAAILAWRQRPDPGARPLVVLLVGQTWWSICIIFEQQALTAGARIFWTNLSVIGVVIIPVAWLLFALAYTGRDWYLQPRYVALMLIIPVLSILVVLAPGFETLYVVEINSVAGGRGMLEQTGIWVWVLAAYTYLLGVLGAMPLLMLVVSGAVTFRRQSLALLTGILTPWMTNILFLAGVLPGVSIDPTPIAFSISGVAYLSAITRHRLFGTSPAPTHRARQHLFDRMQTGAIVVDRNDNIVDLNDTFEASIGHPRPTIVGTPAHDWLPDYDSFPDDGALEGTITLGPNDDTYDVNVTSITDVRGRFIGRVITFHDISELLRQQQRLEVLNRLLRHNIRTETNVIHGYASELEGDAAEIIQERALRVGEFGEKGRVAIDLFDQTHGTTRPRELGALIDHALQDISTGAASITQTRPEEPMYVGSSLGPVVRNLVENAVVHCPQPVRIDIEVEYGPDDGLVSIRVSDDGPGIEASELEVLAAGTETPLAHASGLGLWIIKWGVDIAEGTIEFTTPDDGGTTATITVPVHDPPA